MFESFFGADVYHIIAIFVLYCMLGWLVESIYMSFCNRKITNRGFMVLPFCPIYGFGAVFGYAVLSPLKNNWILLYFAGAILATIFEFLVGKLMIRLFGKLWWDYNDKPFNYKGLLCLESTLAWGMYAIIIVKFLHQRFINLVDFVPKRVGIPSLTVILVIVAIDFIRQLTISLHIDVRAKRDKIIERFRTLRG
ncbi:MAG: putative ABC transporter permease [Clostridium sp.]|jgi:uncharacterized membrane protein|nr:putative ABC transporter permease [Clostridium sp.]